MAGVTRALELQRDTSDAQNGAGAAEGPFIFKIESNEEACRPTQWRAEALSFRL